MMLALEGGGMGTQVLLSTSAWNSSSMANFHLGSLSASIGFLGRAGMGVRERLRG